MKKIIYNSIGGVSLILGMVGVFLPLIPTTCFVLLSTWAFAKSSPRLHTWLSYKSPFAQSIQNWQLHRVIPTKIKWIAATSISFSYSITLLFLDNIYVLIGLGIGMVSLLAYLFTKPSMPYNKTNVSHIAKLLRPIV